MDPEPVEVTGVPGGKHGLSRRRDSGDLDVADLQCSAGALLLGSYAAGGKCCGFIERLHPAIELVGK